jgi:PAS domain S-box-containing protein
MDKSDFFNSYFNNAEINSIIIMDCHGIILEVNRAFTNNFGYTSKDLQGKNFRELFIAADKNKGIPELELEKVLKTGQSHDETFIVSKHGYEVWCSGEVILTETAQGERYLIKDVINLQAKKQVNLFLKSTEELLNRIFTSSQDIPMMILDGSLKISGVNKPFLDLFEIEKAPSSNGGLSSLNHPFWNRREIRSEISKVLVTNTPVKRKKFSYETKSGRQKTILLDTKIVYGKPEAGKKVFIILEEMA